jgi:hypothetical protein
MFKTKNISNLVIIAVKVDSSQLGQIGILNQLKAEHLKVDQMIQSSFQLGHRQFEREMVGWNT